jgi:hypothetical protein
VRLFPKLSLNRLRGRSILDPAILATEQVFLAPPFTPEVAAAVSLISTRLPFRADERSRLLYQAEANAMSEKEYEALSPLIGQMARPRRVLEIGPGLGRSAVYFSKRRLWDEDAEVHLYDATGAQTKYKTRHYDRPPQWPDISSFCGNLPLLRSFLDHNRMANYRIFNAAELPLSRLPGPYDLVYAFFGLGYHWSLEFYLDEVTPLVGENSVLVCTLHRNFRPFARLREFSTRILYCRDIKKNAEPRKLLALSRSKLPEAGVSLAEAFPR